MGVPLTFLGKHNPEQFEIIGQLNVGCYMDNEHGWTGSDELIRELQNHVKTTTAPYKYPRAIEFVDELPKTISGKVRRVELRDREKKRYEELNEHQA